MNEQQKQMNEQQKQNLQDWIDALRSGDYIQTRDRLHVTDTCEYCALGVACEISGLGEWDVYGSYDIPDDDAGLTPVMPKPVALSMGLHKCNPSVVYRGETYNISQLNDDLCLSFEAIANLIEEQLLGVHIQSNSNK